MPSKAITYEDIANPLAQGILSEKEIEVLKNKHKALDALLADAGKAKYKVEVMFSSGYSLTRPSAGALTFWESGSKFHGGGDTIIYICPGKGLGRNDCDAFIPDPSHGLGFLVCPKCYTKWEGTEVYGQLLMRLTVQKWADVLHDYFIKLEGNVDLVMKYYPGSLIVATGAEQEKQSFGENFGKVRGKRAKRVYPMSNIIKDTSAGADLRGRILAFLRA